MVTGRETVRDIQEGGALQWRKGIVPLKNFEGRIQVILGGKFAVRGGKREGRERVVSLLESLKRDFYWSLVDGPQGPKRTS